MTSNTKEGVDKKIHFCQNTGKEKIIFEDNIIVILQEIRYDGVDWINLAQNGIISVLLWNSNDAVCKGIFFWQCM